MGRNKKNKSKQQQQQQQSKSVVAATTDNDTLRYDKLLEILYDVLECSGIVNNDEEDKNKEGDNVWSKLSSSLELLIRYLKEIPSTTKEGESTVNDDFYYYDDDDEEESNGPAFLDVFLKMEQTIQEIQIQTSILFNENQNLKQEILLGQDLEEWCRQFSSLQLASRLRPLHESVLSFFKYRRSMIRQALSTISDCISSIYASSTYPIKVQESDYSKHNNDDIIRQLIQISAQLRCRFVSSKEYPFKEILQIMGNLNTIQQQGNIVANSNADEIYFQSIVDSKKLGMGRPMVIDDDDDSNNLILRNICLLFNKDDSITMIPSPIRDALQTFLLETGNGNINGIESITPPSTILLHGPEGSGKTFICNQVSQICSSYKDNIDSVVKIIQPSLPYDILGLTVGAAENQLFSIMNYAMAVSSSTNNNITKSILILDDIENIVGVDYEGPSSSNLSKNDKTNSHQPSSGSKGEPHVICRLRCLFFDLLDSLHNHDNILMLCTSKTNFAKFTGDRFDVTYGLGLPTPQQRQRMIMDYISSVPSSSLSPTTKIPIDDDTMIEMRLSNLVECTSGCTFAELAQYCRKAIYSTAAGKDKVKDDLRRDEYGPDDNRSAILSTKPILSTEVLFEALKQQLQSSIPESLRTNMSADFVDMTIWTARDLKQRFISDRYHRGAIPMTPSLPLFGISAVKAWEDLRRSIVVPVCHAKELNNLLLGGGSGAARSPSNGKTMAGGVLLTGPPGVGKSALAYHCATVATSINPSVKLIDVSCTSLIHKEVGSSERSIHRLFKIARAAAPCIVLMDGIENVATVRGNDNTTEGTMDRVLSTLLTSLDGIDSGAAPTSSSSDDDAPVNTLAIIGITHNVNWIDPALRRPGRLDRILEVDVPEKEARQKIILQHLERTEFASDDSKFPTLESVSEHVAEQTTGLTGAEIIALCDEAKMLASKEWFDGTQTSSPSLQPQHVFDAMKLRS